MMVIHKRWRVVTYGLLFTIYCLLLPFPVLAQDSDEEVTDDDVNRVAKQLFCPTCENTPVDVCPTQTCADWRALIRQQLEEGQSDEEILAYFAAQYGTGVLANPPREGFGWFLWIAPVVVGLGGVIFFAQYLSRLQRAGQRGAFGGREEVQKGIKSQAAEDKYRAQLEEELRD